MVKVSSGLHGGGVTDNSVGPGTVLPEQGVGSGGKGDDAGMLGGSADMLETGEQVGAFGPCPRQRLLAVKQFRGRGRQPRGRFTTGLSGQEAFGNGRGELVVVQQARQSPVTVGSRVIGGQRTGMLADQVMHAIAAADWLRKQVSVIKRLKIAAGGIQI